jgi:hypothetical protein
MKCTKQKDVCECRRDSYQNIIDEPQKGQPLLLFQLPTDEKEHAFLASSMEKCKDIYHLLKAEIFPFQKTVELGKCFVYWPGK